MSRRTTLALAASAAGVLAAGSAVAGGMFDTPQEVGLPTDAAQLAVECSAHVLILKNWANNGRSTGFETAAIDKAGHGWIPMVYQDFQRRGETAAKAEQTVADRVGAIEDAMQSNSGRTLFSSRAMFCVRHPPA